MQLMAPWSLAQDQIHADRFSIPENLHPPRVSHLEPENLFKRGRRRETGISLHTLDTVPLPQRSIGRTCRKNSPNHPQNLGRKIVKLAGFGICPAYLDSTPGS